MYQTPEHAAELRGFSGASISPRNYNYHSLTDDNNIMRRMSKTCCFVLVLISHSRIHNHLEKYVLMFGTMIDFSILFKDNVHGFISK